MIEIENVGMYFSVSKRYREYITNPFGKPKKFIALESINLKIESGDRVAFLGVNGAGKTTLLKLIGGLLYPKQGTILIDGNDTIKKNLAARKNVGFVLNEERSFYWRLTGRQNLEFFGILDNLSGQDLSRKIDALLLLVGLSIASDSPVANYSSGMKQRLAIARGLLCDPQILILDEPTRTLDPGAVEDIKELILSKIHKDNKRTLLIATHRFEEAEALCNKICIMKNGQIQAFNTLEKILANYANISQFYYSVMNPKELII